MPTAVCNNDSRRSPTVHGRSLSRALHELRAAVREIARHEMEGGAAAARGLAEVMDELDEYPSAHELLSLFLIVDRARNSARKAPPPARYEWEAWSEVSRLTGECIIASLRAMRSTVHASRRRASDSALGVQTSHGIAP